MQLGRKQKIFVTLLIIALAFLAWQVYDIFFAGASSAPPVNTSISNFKSVTPPSTAVPSIASTNTTKTIPIQPIAPMPATTSQIQQPLTLPPATTPNNSFANAPTTPAVVNIAPAQATSAVATQQPMHAVNFQPPLSQNQVEYLRLVNRYQMIRMKRMLIDEEVAIVTSKAKIAELNQQIAKTSGAQTTMAGTGTSLVGQAAPSSPSGYQLLYVDYQQGQWSATLNKNGQFIEVTSGMRLNDGTQVLKIGQSGVVIQQGSATYLLNFYGSTRINYTAARPAAPMSRNTNYRNNNYPANKLATTANRNNINNRVQAVAVGMPSSAVNNPTTLMPNPLANANKTNLTLTSQQKTTVNKLETGLNNKAARNYTDAEKQLLNLPEKHYTLQLLSSYRVSDLDRLSREPALVNNTFIFQTYYLDKALYVLVYGNYATEEQALQVIKILPPNIRQLKPWVRNIASVQAAIKLSPLSRGQ